MLGHYKRPADNRSGRVIRKNRSALRGSQSRRTHTVSHSHLRAGGRFGDRERRRRRPAVVAERARVIRDSRTGPPHRVGTVCRSSGDRSPPGRCRAGRPHSPAAELSADLNWVARAARTQSGYSRWKDDRVVWCWHFRPDTRRSEPWMQIASSTLTARRTEHAHSFRLATS